MLPGDLDTLSPLPVGAFGLALRTVTPDDVDDAELIERLGAWRTLHMGNYPTQFTVTADGTRRWLRDVVIDNPARVMLLIVDRDDPSGPVHGHVGLDRIGSEPGIAYTSNLINGDRSRLPRGAMGAAAQAMLDWARETLGVTRACATVFEDNEPARRLHLRLGFEQTARIPLRRHADGGRVTFRALEPGDDAPPDRWWALMERDT